jgi:hypothetical protein
VLSAAESSILTAFSELELDAPATAMALDGDRIIIANATALSVARVADYRKDRADRPALAVMSRPAADVTPHRLLVTATGQTVTMADEDLVFTDPHQSSRRIKGVRSTSMAALRGGDVVLTPESGPFQYVIYDSTGGYRGGYGELRNLDRDERQNRFMNRGIALTTPDAEVVFVATHAPTALVQRYDRQGRLVGEFVAQGDSIARQTSYVQRFLAARRHEIGGFAVITAATFDPARRWVWLGTTQGPAMHGIFAYDLEGALMKEFALRDARGRDLTFVDEVRVTGDTLMALSQGRIYFFDLVGFVRSGRAGAAWLRLMSAIDGPVLLAQSSCRPYIQVQACTTGCRNGSSIDCRAVLGGQVDLQKVVEVTNYQLSSETSCKLGVKTREGGQEVGHGPIDLQCPPTDNDADGFAMDASPVDCNDGDNTTYPGAPIDCYNSQRDADCNGESDSIQCGFCPVLLDTEGDGVRLTAWTGGVAFDLNGDGHAEPLSWTRGESDDAWLALDRNDNGVVDNGTELFGNYTAQAPSRSPNGFAALMEFDRPENGGNFDGVISAQDQAFGHLLLWTDVNHNGRSEAPELRRLAASGVVALGLDYTESKRVDAYGNEFRYKAKVVSQRRLRIGHWAYDVFLVAAPR